MLIIRSINASGKEKGLIIDFVDRWFGLDAAWQGIYAAYLIAGSIYAPD